MTLPLALPRLLWLPVLPLLPLLFLMLLQPALFLLLLLLSVPTLLSLFHQASPPLLLLLLPVFLMATVVARLLSLLRQEEVSHSLRTHWELTGRTAGYQVRVATGRRPPLRRRASLDMLPPTAL